MMLFDGHSKRHRKSIFVASKHSRASLLLITFIYVACILMLSIAIREKYASFRPLPFSSLHSKREETEKKFPSFHVRGSSLLFEKHLLTVYYFFRETACEGQWRSKNCYTDIVRFAKHRQKNGKIVVVVAASGIHDVLLNWCISAQRLGIDNYIIVAIDRETFAFLKGKGAPVVSYPNPLHRVHKSVVWIQRTFMTYMLLKEGLDVLVSDADAVMIKSPFHSRRSRFWDSSLDIITTPSNFPNPKDLPEECSFQSQRQMEWRNQPCMGWIYLRSNDRMMKFFEETFMYYTVALRDDQIGFNCAIRRSGGLWRDPKSWKSSLPMTTYLQKPRLKLHMLSGNHYVRNCTDSEDPQHNFFGLFQFRREEVELYHCKGKRKIANARNNGFLFLRDDWRIYSATNQSFKSFLSSISV